MKKHVGLWQLFGFAITTLIGTLLHFLYEWSPSLITAVFSGVNESTWEHMKLIFWPMLAFAVIQSFFFREYDSFWSIKLRGTLVGISLIPLIFYTYNGVIGKSPDFINISIFFVAAAVAYIYETWLFYDDESFFISKKYALLCLALIATAFTAFTFKTPTLEIFRDPITGSFGIS